MESKRDHELGVKTLMLWFGVAFVVIVLVSLVMRLGRPTASATTKEQRSSQRVPRVRRGAVGEKPSGPPPTPSRGGLPERSILDQNTDTTEGMEPVRPEDVFPQP